MESAESYGTRKFLTVLTKSGQWPLSWTGRMQTTICHISIRSTLIQSTHLCLGLSSDSLFQISPQNLCTHLSFLSCVLHVPLTSSSLSWSRNLATNISYGVLHCVIFSNLFFLRPHRSKVSPRPSSQTPPLFILPLMWETSFKPIQNNRQNVMKLS